MRSGLYRREGVGWWRCKRACTRERPSSRLGGQGTRGAHVEHVARGCDLGRVEAQRLVERRRVLPSRREGIIRDARRGAVWEAGRCGVVAAQAAVHGEGPTQEAWGGQGTHGAHPEHALHDCDTGGVEAQRLVERVRLLPSRREGMRCMRYEVRAGRWEGLGRGAAQTACTANVWLKAWGTRHMHARSAR